MITNQQNQYKGIDFKAGFREYIACMLFLAFYILIASFLKVFFSNTFLHDVSGLDIAIITGVIGGLSYAISSFRLNKE